VTETDLILVDARLDGSTSRPRRALDIKLFQQANSPYQIFLISTRAGGLGINLTAATSVVLVDQDWNPQVSSSPHFQVSRLLTIFSERSIFKLFQELIVSVKQRLFKFTESFVKIQ
jgi:hypothetical protein